MKFTLEGQILKEIVKSISPLLSGKVIQEQLANVLFEIKGGYLLVTVSNGTDWIAQRIAEVEIEEEGACAIPRDFLKVISNLKGLVSFELIDTKLHVKQGKSKFHSVIFDAEEFPKMAQAKPLYQLHYNGTQWRNLVNYTAYAAAVSESRPVLQGVAFNISADKQTFTCTDSHRLATVEFTQSTPKVDNLQVVIPATSLRATLSSFDLSKDVMVVGFSNSVAVMNDNVIYTIRALEGNYPATDRLIPQSFKSEYIVSRTELIDGLKLIGKFSKDDKNNTVACTLSADSFVLKGRDETAQGEIALEVTEMTGEDVVISFNAKYALEVLNALQSKYVRFKFNGGKTPFCMFGEDEVDANVLGLILPVRTY